MTTTIRDTYATADKVKISKQPGGKGQVRIETRNGGQLNFNVLDLAEFLAAVATELDVITIPRTTVEQVSGPDDDGDYLITSTGPFEDEWVDAKHTPDAIRQTAHELLAIAEHKAANPPIDQAQVDALYDALVNEDGGDLAEVDLGTLARRLVKAGVRAPQEADK